MIYFQIYIKYTGADGWHGHVAMMPKWPRTARSYSLSFQRWAAIAVAVRSAHVARRLRPVQGKDVSINRYLSAVVNTMSGCRRLRSTTHVSTSMLAVLMRDRDGQLSAKYKHRERGDMKSELHHYDVAYTRSHAGAQHMQDRCRSSLPNERMDKPRARRCLTKMCVKKVRK